MGSETYYDILGIRPDATHREVVHVFARLAEHYGKEAGSNPSAHERFQQVKLAYETLTDYGSRVHYNIEHGFPDPPRTDKDAERSGILAQIGVLVPANWPVLLPWLFLVISGNVGYYLLVGELPWACFGCTSSADYVVYAITATFVVALVHLLWGRE